MIPSPDFVAGVGKVSFGTRIFACYWDRESISLVGSAIAYYYFDFKYASEHHVRSLPRLVDVPSLPTWLRLTVAWMFLHRKGTILSACSTLIAASDVQESLGSLTSPYILGCTIRRHYIPLDAAHTILAQACLTELLQLDENVDNERLAMHPLDSYAAQHWFEGVGSRVLDIMRRLIDQRKSYLAAWIKIHDVDGHPFPAYEPPREGNCIVLCFGMWFQ